MFRLFNLALCLSWGKSYFWSWFCFLAWNFIETFCPEFLDARIIGGFFVGTQTFLYRAGGLERCLSFFVCRIIFPAGNSDREISMGNSESYSRRRLRRGKPIGCGNSYLPRTFAEFFFYARKIIPITDFVFAKEISFKTGKYFQTRMEENLDARKSGGNLLIREEIYRSGKKFIDWVLKINFTKTDKIL